MSPSKAQIMAAISGALTAYLAEEEAACQAAQLQAAAAPSPAPPVNLWGLSGRSQAMQWRLLAQRRSLR